MIQNNIPETVKVPLDDLPFFEAVNTYLFVRIVTVFLLVLPPGELVKYCA